MEALFFAALDRGTEAERAAFLESASGGDAELRRQVEKLLDAHSKVGDFLKRPVVEQLIAAPRSPEAAQEQDPSTAGECVLTPRRKGDVEPQTQAEPASDDEEDHIAFLEPSQRPDALGRLGHYDVLQVLGQGGFGIVFRAYDDVLQRVVAVKVLSPHMAATSPARKRFLRESRCYAQVRHENVVQVYAVEEKPLPYLVMEFIPGETLQQRLDRTGPLEVAEILPIGRQIAEGLAAAHATDLIHRDIKPANLLLENGLARVKITDFGLARAADDASLTGSGVVTGTPMYMSPEQAQGESFDHRADLFSLGSVLYVMATGRPPFRASTTLAVLKRVAEDQPRPIREVIPEVPEWLCAIVAKLQAKDPAARFQSAREVADLLADCEAKLLAHQEVKNILPARAGWKKWFGAAVLLPILALALAVTEFAGVTHLFQGLQPMPQPAPAVPAARQETLPFAVAPLDAARALGLQQAWGKHLGVPVEATSKGGMKLILIPPAGAWLPKAYYLGKCEVTQGEWELVMGYNPSGFGPKNPRMAGRDTSKYPVEQVSWLDSLEFCNKLSAREGMKPYYELAVTKRSGPSIAEAEVTLLGGNGYRIPTHPESEHACRAGTTTKYHFGDNEEDLQEHAWFDKNSEGRTHPVGQKKPNAFGLYDMHGNVWEWCANEVPADPRDPKGASWRVFRGGSWDGTAGFCSTGYFYRRAPSDRVYSIGLRLARVP